MFPPLIVMLFPLLRVAPPPIPALDHTPLAVRLPFTFELIVKCPVTASSNFKPDESVDASVLSPSNINVNFAVFFTSKAISALIFIFLIVIVPLKLSLTIIFSDVCVPSPVTVYVPLLLKVSVFASLSYVQLEPDTPPVTLKLPALFSAFVSASFKV